MEAGIAAENDLKMKLELVLEKVLEENRRLNNGKFDTVYKEAGSNVHHELDHTEVDR